MCVRKQHMSALSHHPQHTVVVVLWVMKWVGAVVCWIRWVGLEMIARKYQPSFRRQLSILYSQRPRSFRYSLINSICTYTCVSEFGFFCVQTIAREVMCLRFLFFSTYRFLVFLVRLFYYDKINWWIVVWSIATWVALVSFLLQFYQTI